MAERRSITDTQWLGITLVGAFVLTLWPWGEWLDPIWPQWVVLVMVYWVLEGNRLRWVGQAFLLGLALDVLTGNVLGAQALSLVVLTFFLTRFRNQMRFFPPWQQAVAVMALLYIDRLLVFGVFVSTGEPWPSALWWLSPLVGMVMWPWLFLGLDRLRHKRRLPL